MQVTKSWAGHGNKAKGTFEKVLLLDWTPPYTLEACSTHKYAIKPFLDQLSVILRIPGLARAGYGAILPILPTRTL